MKLRDSVRSSSSSRRAATFEYSGAVDQAAGAHHHCRADVLERNAVEQVLDGFVIDALGADAGQAFTGFVDDGAQARGVERRYAAVVELDGKLDNFLVFRPVVRMRNMLRARGGAFFAIEHIGARNFLLAVTHQRQFYLVLDVFDVKGAAIGLTSCQGRNHEVGQLLDGFMYPRRSRGLATFDRKERLGHRDSNLVFVKTG